MGSVIHISRYRGVAQRDLPLSVAIGDSDLVPIAVILWIASTARVILALLHHETFGAEATFALFCVMLLPLFVFKARSRRVTSQQ